MHKIYNKELKQFTLNPRLSRSSIIHLTANFGLVLRSKTITFKCLERLFGFQSVM